MHTATRGFARTLRTRGDADDVTKYSVPSTYEYSTPTTSGRLADDDVASVQKECRSIARLTSFRCRSSDIGTLRGRAYVRSPAGASCGGQRGGRRAASSAGCGGSK